MFSKVSLPLAGIMLVSLSASLTAQIPLDLEKDLATIAVSSGSGGFTDRITVIPGDGLSLRFATEVEAKMTLLASVATDQGELDPDNLVMGQPLPFGAPGEATFDLTIPQQMSPVSIALRALVVTGDGEVFVTPRVLVKVDAGLPANEQ